MTLSARAAGRAALDVRRVRAPCAARSLRAATVQTNHQQHAAARCPACGGVLLFASGVEVCANRRCSRYGEPS